VRLIDRYIGRQLFVTAIFAVLVLTILLVLGTIFKKLLDVLVNQNASLRSVIGIIVAVLPFSLTYSIPWGFLTSVLLVFGRMSSENELTALRTSGVSLNRMCAAVWVLALFFATICLWINLYIAPIAHAQIRNAALEILKSNPLALFGTDKVIEDFPGRKIFVGASNGGRLKNIHIFELDEKDGSLKNTTFAREGVLSVEDSADSKAGPGEEKEKDIILRLSKGRYEERNEDFPDRIDHWRYGITIGEGSIKISLRELYEAKKKSGGPQVMTIEELLKPEGAKPGERLVEINKRVSNALATLAFALLAVPLAISAQRKETSVGFAIALAIGLVYFLLFFIVDTFRNRPNLHPELLVWLPNFIFISIGGARFWSLSRR
jgi:lipopolysaccharide export LptBFGC system permease protein LptF